MNRNTIILIISAALLGLYVLLVAPLSEKRVELKDSLLEEYKTMLKHERFISSTQNTKADIKKATGELEDMEQYIIHETDISLAFASLQSKVQDLAETSGLKITSIKPMQAIKYDGYKGLPLHLDCTGDIKQLSTFLNYLDSSWEFIAIDRLNISVVPQDMLRVKIQLSGLMKT